MKLLVTGSNGFIGKYFISKYGDKYNIKTFSFKNDDFNNLDLEEIDIIVHLSALVHQMKGASKYEYEKVNVIETFTLAKKAKKSGVKQFVFMSTIKVYGEESNDIYTENSPCNPKDEYGKSKLKAEAELLKFDENDFKVSIIRTPIVYGYGVKANIQKLVKLVNNVPILPFGKIKNKRSMVYIGNLCHLVDELIVQNKAGTFLANDDKSLSTTNLIEAIAGSLKKKRLLLKIPFFGSLLKRFKPSFYKRLYRSLEVNNTITKKKLNLQNPYSIEEGMQLMITAEFK